MTLAKKQLNKETKKERKKLKARAGTSNKATHANCEVQWPNERAGESKILHTRSAALLGSRIMTTRGM